MKIETERLVLRRWRDDDLEPLARILLHPDVARWLDAADATIDDVARVIERYQKHWQELGFGRFAVEDRASGALVGRAGIMWENSWLAGACKHEVGWVIDPPRWGEGLATEAATAAIADGFARCHLDRVVAFTPPENLASRRVMEKCGLHLIGTASWNGRIHVWYARDSPPGR